MQKNFSLESRKVNLNHYQNQEIEEKYLNNTLYFNMLNLFETRSKILQTKYPSHLIEDVLRHSEFPSTNFNFVRAKDHPGFHTC